LQTVDPTFTPAHPVTAAVVRTVEDEPPSGPMITDAVTAAVSDLFNVINDLILQMVCRFFAFGHESQAQLRTLANVAVGLMFGAIKPLGLLLATLPVGEGVPGTAGANFQLAYRANFLLPHQRVAWIRFAERLDEAADAAMGMDAPPHVRDVLLSVAQELQRVQGQITKRLEG
jgi:hypothetical protein